MEECLEDIFAIETPKEITNVAIPWVEKYRPKTLDDMVLDENTKNKLKIMIANKNIVNMTLFGNAGIGKTTLAKVIANSINAEVLFLNCGVEGTVDVVRNRIQPFCESASSGRIKCVILDEFDAASGGVSSLNGMQKALRSLMEAFTDTRFIITCNYTKNIINPIFSRCQKININYSVKEVAVKLKNIWDRESIKYEPTIAREFVKKYVVPNMPDIRLIINIAELMCVNGELSIEDNVELGNLNDDIDKFSDKLLELIKNKTDIKSLRILLNTNINIFSNNYEMLASALMKSVMNNNYNYNVIPIIANYSYRMSQVLDPSLQMMGLIVSLYEKV